MKRPQLTHFIAVQTKSAISIRASCNYISKTMQQSRDFEENKLQTPLEALGLLGGHRFQLKILGLDEKHCVLFKKSYASDAYGNFECKISLPSSAEQVYSLQVFETSCVPGIDLLLGTRIPIKMKYPKKIVVSDFDKTLVDTRYSTPQEVYQSLRNPIAHFPTIPQSLKVLKGYIEQGLQPFILSASPHFYENAIRDWLYQNKIYTAEILLKDYRKIISIWDRLLTTKDVKSQGFYKLNHLVSILLMTGVPEELVLIGDGFESDPLIYLILSALLHQQLPPWNIWNEAKKLKAFRMNHRQDSLFLNKVYQLQNAIKKKATKPHLTIHIRCPRHVAIQPITLPFLKRQEHLINYYQDQAPA